VKTRFQSLPSNSTCNHYTAEQLAIQKTGSADTYHTAKDRMPRSVDLTKALEAYERTLQSSSERTPPLDVVSLSHVVEGGGETRLRKSTKFAPSGSAGEEPAKLPWRIEMLTELIPLAREVEAIEQEKRPLRYEQSTRREEKIRSEIDALQAEAATKNKNFSKNSASSRVWDSLRIRKGAALDTLEEVTKFSLYASEMCECLAVRPNLAWTAEARAVGWCKLNSVDP
jgi:hypothetical protein